MSTAVQTRRPAASTPVTTSSRNPFAMLRKEMDDLMARFWNGSQESWFAGAFSPSADLVETDNACELRMDLPGLEAKDINVQVSGNTVTISGQRKEEKEEKGATCHCIERKSGSFSRTLSLPCDVNEDEVAAEYNKGVLTVKLPKCEESKPKQIAVKGS